MYTVYFENHVESFEVNKFDTLCEAKKYCSQITKGKKKISEFDNTLKFERLHIYKGELIEIIDDEPSLKDPVYSTKCYYNLNII